MVRSKSKRDENDDGLGLGYEGYKGFFLFLVNYLSAFNDLHLYLLRRGLNRLSRILPLASKATFTLYRITFDPIQKCTFSLAFTQYRITFNPIQKCTFSLAFTQYRYSFGAVQVQNCSSFLAGTKLLT